jgi:protein phosphatase
VITRALGTDPDVDVDSFAVHAQDGDVFLICSDGLTTMVGDEDILELLERNGDDLARAAKELVAAANRHGGEDNITVVAFRIAVEAGDATVTLPVAVPEQPAPPSPPPASTAASVPAPRTRPAESRARIGITMAVLLLIAVLLVVWGLTR